MTNIDLKRRIVELSYKHKLSHLGSCLSAVDIIDEIFRQKRPTDKFVLSNGHAGLALYVVIEKYEGKNAEEILLHHGVHPDRCVSCRLDCSSGSLGHGLPIALGIALANREKTVWCLISDGECSEGSIWEALRIKEEQQAENLKVYVNYNGYGAYKTIGKWNYSLKLSAFGVDMNNIIVTRVDELPFLQGLDAHYHVMTDEEYNQAMELLK